MGGKQREVNEPATYPRYDQCEYLSLWFSLIFSKGHITSYQALLLKLLLIDRQATLPEASHDLGFV